MSSCSSTKEGKKKIFKINKKIQLNKETRKLTHPLWLYLSKKHENGHQQRQESKEREGGYFMVKQWEWVSGLVWSLPNIAPGCWDQGGTGRKLGTIG